VTATTSVLIMGYGAFGRALFHALEPNEGLAISVYRRTPNADTDPLSAAAIYHDLPGVPLDRFDIVLVAVPSYAVEETVGALPLRRDGRDPVFISCAKGIDSATGLFPSALLARLTASRRYGALSGPSFTDEMVAGKRTMVAVATPDLDLARSVSARLQTTGFRLEPTDDVNGLQFCSVAKNIIALGAGISDALSYGENYRAAFVARGVVELTDLLPRLGGQAKTLHSIGGLGDILLTCVSPRSRNYRMGFAIGSRGSSETIMSEGLSSATAFVRYLEGQGIFSPYFERIVAAIDRPESIGDLLND